MKRSTLVCGWLVAIICSKPSVVVRDWNERMPAFATSTSIPS